MNKKLSSTPLLLAAAFGCFALSAQAAGDNAPADRGPDSARHEEMLKRFDANGDGKLDATEREAAKAAMADRRGNGPREGAPGKMRERGMNRFDTDGDGTVSEAERTAGEATLRAELASRPKAMARVDTDGDGKISDTEWAAAREQMKNRMGQGQGPDGERPRRNRDAQN